MVGLFSLRGFAPLLFYPPSEGMVNTMTEEKRETQRDLMLALLIEMTVFAASPLEIARAVRHSMVVMDSLKHNLDYVQSAIDNDIVGLAKKYLNTTQEVIDSIIT